MDALKQAVDGREAETLDLFLWGGVLVAALLVLGFFVLMARRKMLARSGVAASEAFSIEDLAAMRASGQLSDEEFKQLRAAALGMAPPTQPIMASTDESVAATSEESAENDGNCPSSEAGPADDS